MNPGPERTSTSKAVSIPPAEMDLILRLRLLIARAANKDSLAWWDDESLASHSAFLLDRLFPVSPQAAARSLALRAAESRHQAALAAEPNALHLFHLDIANQDELAARQVAMETVYVPGEPIDTIEVLRVRLAELLGEPKPYKRVRQARNQGMLIELPPAPAGISVWQHRAQTLAWAYLEGAHSDPVFPFVME